jgi:hypothetical protein
MMKGRKLAMSMLPPQRRAGPIELGAELSPVPEGTMNPNAPAFHKNRKKRLQRVYKARRTLMAL